jgi:hypothetical protein
MAAEKALPCPLRGGAGAEGGGEVVVADADDADSPAAASWARAAAMRPMM